MTKGLFGVIALLACSLLSGCNKTNENIEKVKQNTLKNYIFVQGAPLQWAISVER